MPKIVWDKIDEREFETGLKHGVLYPMGSSGYDKGVPWNGLTAVNESPEGAEPTDLWADDMKYATLRSAETFGYTIEAYMYPDEFAECDGSAEPVTGVKFGQQKRKAFGFSYVTTKGTAENLEEGYIIHIIYNSTASPSEKSYQTINDSPEAITFSWECNTTPIVVEHEDYPNLKPVASITIDSTKVDSTKLKALEKLLYGSDPTTEGGTDGTDAQLPDPEDIIDIFDT